MVERRVKEQFPSAFVKYVETFIVPFGKILINLQVRSVHKEMARLSNKELWHILYLG